MFITIAINSSSEPTAVAILCAGQILAEKSWSSNRDEAAKIIPAIAALLKKSHVQFRDVEKVLVINGPGPFTGMRIGVTIANAIAWATKSKLQTATTAELLKTKGKSFGEVALQLQKKAKTVKFAKALYLKKPHITTPKRTYEPQASML